MSVPNFQQQVTELANKYPREFREAHTGGPNTELFIKIVAYELHKLEPRIGLNGKRGTDTLSQDAINYKGVGIGYDPTNNQPVTVIDIIGGAGGPDPRPAWMVLNDPNEPSHRGPGKWIQPLPVPGYHTSGPVVVPNPPPPPSIEPSVINALQAVENQLKLISQQVAELTDERKHVVAIVQTCVDQLVQSTETVAKNSEKVEAVTAQLNRGFKVDVKGGYLVGNIRGSIDLKE